MANDPVDKSKLMAYITGELEEYEKLKLRRAIDSDPELRREVELLRETNANLRSYYREKTDLRFSAEQLQRIRMEAEKSTKPPSKEKRTIPAWWFGLGGGLAAAAVLILVVNTNRHAQLEGVGAKVNSKEVAKRESSVGSAPNESGSEAIAGGDSRGLGVGGGSAGAGAGGTATVAAAPPPTLQSARAEKSEDLEAEFQQPANPQKMAVNFGGGEVKGAAKAKKPNVPMRDIPPPPIAGLSKKAAKSDEGPSYDFSKPDSKLFANEVAPLADVPAPTGRVAARLRHAPPVSQHFYTVQVGKVAIKVSPNLNHQKISEHVYTRLHNNQTCFPRSIPEDDAQVDIRLILTISKIGQIQSVEIRPRVGDVREISSCITGTLQNSVAFVFAKGDEAKVTIPIKLK